MPEMPPLVHSHLQALEMPRLTPRSRSAALCLPRERHIRGKVQHDKQDGQAANAAAHAELHVLAGQDVVTALPPCGEVWGRRSMLHQQEMI